jgi:uncharacterized OsmC-like protein/pimeloyl-ACP methyl ester carboxylesterase
MQFDFPNSNGEILSGRLEMPAGEPVATALFAHCFTCSKDLIAPSVIAKTLTNNGIAVLRFDFTGLGNSQGDFSNTNFSSNVGDLVAAYNHLGEKFKKPEILIGHSLGGAAVLKAAQELEQVKAIVTLGAPSDVSHIKNLFCEVLPQIEADGEAKVMLADRPFTIKQQLIDDIAESDILSGLSQSQKALLVMHSPLDTTVSIDHAAKIFAAAKHPKSFVTLDDADHLLSRREDAQYAGEVIGAWVARYIAKQKGAQGLELPSKTVVVKSRPGSRFTHDIYTDKHHIVADEPSDVGGDNLGLDPYSLLLASLGACTAMTLKMYAEHKQIGLEAVSVHLAHKKIHAEDCQDCATQSGKIDHIEKTIELEGDLTHEQRMRMLEVAEKCPVNKTLLSEIKITSQRK